MTDLRLGSLFSGTTALDMAVASLTGVRTAWHSDIKPAARTLLEHRYPGVPNLGDITKVDWGAVEPVEILTAGFPCTDVSGAGKRRGLIRLGDDKTRSGLWAEVARCIQHLRPDLVVLENVRGLLSAKADGELERCPWCVGDGSAEHMRALGAVLGDLADVGFDAEWTSVLASDVGSCHARFRVFILAWPAAGRARWVDELAGQIAEHAAGLTGLAADA